MKNTNAEALYEYLKKKLKSKKPLHEKISAWNAKQTFDFRLSRVDDVARFAALYSDYVLIHDPFSSINVHLPDDDFENNVRYELLIAITLLLYLKPLVEKGIIGFASSEFHFCDECYQRYIKDMEFIKYKNKINSVLEQRILNEVTFQAVIYDDEPQIRAQGPEDLVSHGATRLLISGNSDDDLSKLVVKRAASKKSPFLSQKEIQKFGILNSLAGPIMSDLTIQNYYSEMYGVQYISDSEVDFELLSTMNHSKVNTLSNALAEGLSHSVPYLSDVEISKLLELREKEGESFNVYRDSFSKAIQSVDEPNADNIKQIFNDTVRPEINNIELTIRNSRKLLWGSLTTDFCNKKVTKYAIIKA